MELGFWTFAQKDPSYLALVSPEGEQVSAGDLGEGDRRDDVGLGVGAGGGGVLRSAEAGSGQK